MVALEPYIERDGTAAGSNVIMDLVNDAPNVSFEIEHTKVYIYVPKVLPEASIN